jgi:hypothetical protein
MKKQKDITESYLANLQEDSGDVLAVVGLLGAFVAFVALLIYLQKKYGLTHPNHPTLRRLNHRHENELEHCERMYPPLDDTQVSVNIGGYTADYESYQEHPKFYNCQMLADVRWYKDVVLFLKDNTTTEICKYVHYESCARWVDNYLPLLEEELKSLENSLSSQKSLNKEQFNKLSRIKKVVSRFVKK